jgi:hypothetical protein
MQSYRFSLAAAWVVGGLGWLLVGFAFVQFAMAVFAPPDPMFRASSTLYLWGAVMKAGMSLIGGLCLAVFGGMARAMVALAQRE